MKKLTTFRDPYLDSLKKIIPFLCFVVLLFMPVALLARPSDEIAAMQQQVITGKVTDNQTGEAMVGVNISVKSTITGAISGSDGTFSVTVADKNAVLVFSFIGYTTQEIALAGRSMIEVALLNVASELSEVVVVGYDTQKKINLSGAVDNVDAAELKSRPITNISQGRQGVVPNL